MARRKVVRLDAKVLRDETLEVGPLLCAHFGDGDRSVRHHEHPQKVSSVSGRKQPVEVIESGHSTLKATGRRLLRRSRLLLARMRASRLVGAHVVTFHRTCRCHTVPQKKLPT